MIARRWQRSLRGKLIAACALIQLLASALLWAGSSEILTHTLSDQASHQTRQVSALLNQSIAIPLVQRDYAGLQQTVERVVSDQAINYLVLFDHRDRIVASAGWDPARVLPPRDGARTDLEQPDTTLHLASVIELSGQHLGRASFGLSTQGLRSARAAFLRQSFAVAALTLLLSTALITALAIALTRRLVRLEQSSRRIADAFMKTLPWNGRSSGAARALYDPLTGLLNRRGLFEALATEMQHTAAQGSGLVLMFVDLDDFKRANDVGGHRTGDDILVAVGAALTAEMRAGALVARIGGDEFALACPAISVAEGGVIAARLVGVVSCLRFVAGSEILGIGCSIGVASFPEDAATPDEPARRRIAGLRGRRTS